MWPSQNIWTLNKLKDLSSVTYFPVWTKGGLISEFFSTLAQISKKFPISSPWALYTEREYAQGSDFAPIFGNVFESKWKTFWD